MVSGTMALTQATLRGGSAGIRAQRGNDVWGASWAFASGGAQGDILTLSDVLNNFSTSGAYATDAEVAAASGAAVITASGGAVAVATTRIAAASGAITSGGALLQPTITSGTFVGVQAMSTSGTVVFGSAAKPVSGIVLVGTDGKGYRLVFDPTTMFCSGILATV